MKKILFLFALTFSVIVAFTQPFFEKTRTMNAAGLQLYVVSPSDLGYEKNMIAATYDDIITQASSKGYRPCPEYITNKLFETFSDGMTGRESSSFKWLKVVTPSGIYTIGKNENGKFMDRSSRNTFHVFLSHSHACWVFIK
ncbi:MAG: hypothetical protein KBB91_00295 [Candidatus Pacebacteria bacterium]|jgi:hypothetical protein|nr:hypothetical protein [Candidatus Paceibacterota bacterium]MBP9701116.1 hypothetical protein [Candidatus Paceibacterota bacterium]